MPTTHELALELIRDLFSHLDAEEIILASERDANFFRKSASPAILKTPSPPSLPQVFSEPLKNKSFAPSLKPSSGSVNQHPAPPPFPPEQNQKTASSPLKPMKPIENLIPLKKEFFQSLFLKIAPEFTTLDDIPSDAMAKKIAERWKTKNQTAPISLLSLSEPPEQKAFLENIAKALNIRFAPCRLVNAESIEKEGRWRDFLVASELKLIVVCDYTLWQLNKLMAHYKENPTTGVRTLDSIPLLLLPDLSLYLKDPLLKRSLWKALCQKISS